MGGVINFIAKVRAGHTRAFNLLELVGEIMTSAFVGVGVFMLLQSFDEPVGVCAAMSGVGGHMATRLLFLVERWVEGRITGVKK